MTREDIEKIVEKTVEWLNGYAFTDDDKSAHIPTLIHDFLKDSRVYFDDLSQPSLPSDLDEAAKEYSCTKNPYGANAFRAGAEWRNQQIPKLPDNLDEAIKMVDLPYEEINNTFEHSNIIEICKRLRESAFKAGAEWMAGQGYTKEETVYFERLCDENRIMVDLGWGEPERGGFNPGDKVIVQIRKK